tara:strand:- start:68008 stop:69789 length:1782 start_codon:yes stop_codon:yes gene_type:complete
MIFINLFHNIIIFFGLSFLGSLILLKINLGNIYKDKVINLFFEFIVGFIFISILIYLVSLYNFYIINITYGINFILFVFSIIKINKDTIILRDINKFFYSDKILIIFFIILIFYSFLPATDADSIAYHFDIPKKIFENGALSFNTLHYHEIFYGPGEAFYLLGAAIHNYQLPHFINFLALIIIYAIFRDKFFKNKYIRNQKIFLYILLSIPVIFQLFSIGKPQLVFIAINLFFFSIIFNNNFKENFLKKNILSFFFLMLLSFLAVILSKITFVITCFILICYFLIKNHLIFKFFNFYYLLTFFLGLSCLILYQKYLIYGDYSFYFLKLNNLNFENNFIDFLNKIKVSNNYQNFPLNLFFPTSGSILLDNLGYTSILIFTIFLFLKNNKLEKIIVILCILLLYLAGLKHARFYAEILLFCSYILISDYKFFSKYKNYFLIKLLVIPQLLYITLFLFYLGYLDTKIFSSNLKINYLRDNAFGYSMNEFLNSNIKEKSTILIDYRSLFYSKHEMYYLESLKFGDLNDNAIFAIKNIKPDYIVNVGTQKTLSACQGQKILEKYLKVNASRNPIKKIKSNIKVSVYKFNTSSKECLIK